MAQAIFDDLYLSALAAEADEHIKDFNLEKYYYDGFLLNGLLASFPSRQQQQIAFCNPDTFSSADYWPSEGYAACFETPVDFQWHSGDSQYEYNPTCLFTQVLQASPETNEAFGNAYPSDNMAAHHDEPVQQALQSPLTPALHYSLATITGQDDLYDHPGYTFQPIPSIVPPEDSTDCCGIDISSAQRGDYGRDTLKNCHQPKTPHCLPTQMVAATSNLRRQQHENKWKISSVPLSREAEKPNTHRSIQAPGAGAVASSQEHLIERPAHSEALLDGRTSLASAGVVKRNAHTAVDLLSEKGRPEAKPAMKEFKFVMHDPLAPKRIRNSKRKTTEDLEANSPPSPSERPVKRLRMATASPLPGSPSSSVPSSA
ncbi:hypothetical protein CVT26_012045 [Gymnopilus dilepis]|uniref:Uncharacterized protein n=1 Tax=Gymnopilus dilepis TaxID=231916 RepID=A0A409VYC6_9AGAR|nr:hypothetical protein CVT26_012045 [Gymnopilus dilepis]